MCKAIDFNPRTTLSYPSPSQVSIKIPGLRSTGAIFRQGDQNGGELGVDFDGGFGVGIEIVSFEIMIFFCPFE